MYQVNSTWAILMGKPKLCGTNIQSQRVWNEVLCCIVFLRHHKHCR